MTTSHVFCCKCFTQMFQRYVAMFYTDVVKLDRDVAYVAMVIHVYCKLLFSMFHLFVQTYFASVFIWMLHMFHTYVASILSGCCVYFAMISSVFSRFSSVSNACFKCFICFQTYVTCVLSGCGKWLCCKCMFWMFCMFQAYVAIIVSSEYCKSRSGCRCGGSLRPCEGSRWRTRGGVNSLS